MSTKSQAVERFNAIRALSVGGLLVRATDFDALTARCTKAEQDVARLRDHVRATNEYLAVLVVADNDPKASELARAGTVLLQDIGGREAGERVAL